MKHGNIPLKQDRVIAALLKRDMPTTYRFIMSLPGNPRIFEVAHGFQDHVKFIVDSGLGKSTIEALEFRAKSYTNIISVDGADIITWWM